MERTNKIISTLKEAGIDLAILVSPPNVTYSSGFEVPYWPAFMGDMSNGLPMVTTCIGMKSEELWMAASDFYKSKLTRANQFHVSFFRTFTHTKRNDVNLNFKAALLEAVERCMDRTGHMIIGVEFGQCPLYVIEILKGLGEQIEFADITAYLNVARLIKTPEEIMMLEHAAKVADEAQNALYDISKQPGSYTELDIWFEVQKAVSRKSGVLTPFVGELVTGQRAGLSDYPLGPTDRVVLRGDIGIMDISPRVDGYWADCSNVVVFWEKPDQEQIRYFKAVKEIYEAGRDAIYPGITCQEVNQIMREVYQKHGFDMCSYQGHQIGANVNERPKFTYCDETVLEENMVVCIEPQIYTGSSGKTGVRLERMLHITKDGARELNYFPWGIELD